MHIPVNSENTKSKKKPLAAFWSRLLLHLRKIFASTSIRNRLLAVFLLMVIIPALGISIGSILVATNTGRQQVLDNLNSVALLREFEIKTWIQSLQNEMTVALSEEYALDRARVVLTLAQNARYYEFYNKAARGRLMRFVGDGHSLAEIFFVNLDGTVILSTETAHEGLDFSDQAFFLAGLEGSATQFWPASAGANPEYVIVSAPVKSANGQLLGIMAGKASLSNLIILLSDRSGLGKTGKTYLVDQFHHVYHGNPVTAVNGENPDVLDPSSSEAIRNGLLNQQGGSGIYEDYRGVRVVGIYLWIPELRAVFLVEQDLSEAYVGVLTSLAINLSIVLVSVGLGMVAAMLVSRSIVNPIGKLVATAKKIENGDLQQTAYVEYKDEIGMLASVFNNMTAQLRELISGLERKVEERTRTLHRRAIQLETTLQVSQRITSLLDINQLLSHIAELIRGSFGYSQVQIFLCNTENNQLEIRAGDRIPGCPDLIEQAIKCSQAILLGNGRSESEVELTLQQLGIRSALALPLFYGDLTIGVMAIYSPDPHAFVHDDVLVIQSLSGQIAIAIENARLYEQSKKLAVLEERNRLAREMHDSVTQSLYSLGLLIEGWRMMKNGGEDVDLDKLLDKSSEVTNQTLKEMRLLIHELRPPQLETEGLWGTLIQRLNEVEKHAGINAHLITDDFVELEPSLQECLYRIATEALNNALKHAGAANLSITSHYNENTITMEIKDDGKGFDLAIAENAGGMGIANMKGRASELSGGLSIETAPGCGTNVRVYLPMHPGKIGVRNEGKSYE